MSAMIEHLEAIEKRYQELGEQMMSPSVLGDRKTMAKLGKEQAALSGIVEAYEELKKVQQGIDESNLMLKDEDREVAEMAKAELETLEPKKQQILDHLEILMVPRDPLDSNNAIVEIRGAAGGDEGNIFAGDLYRMYAKWAEAKGFSVEIIESQPSEAGGFALISFMVKGDGAYGLLKFESGSHRVQRVPKTESAGRIHTSTATVLVDPEVDEEDFEINMNDLDIDTMRASGAGGQHVNKTDSAVRIVHKPTGITVKCQDGRSQHENRATALNTIRAKVAAYMRSKEDAAKESERQSKLGTGDRSEKIRTYNYPQNRVTDHRIGLTLQQLDRVMEGRMDDILEALAAQDQKDRIAGNKE